MKKVYLLLALFCCMSHFSFAQVAITPASGGSAICGPTPACTTLGTITITETNIADFSNGSDQLVLTPPAGWQFCTGTPPALNFAGGGDVTAVVGGGFTSTAVTVNVTAGGTSNPDEITITGLMVQPLTPTSVPGAITASGVTGINGITPAVTGFGNLALFPGQIIGAHAVCAGATTPLTDAAAGGNWTSSNTGIATINPTSGLLTTIPSTSGTTVITYSVSPGCSTSFTFSVVTTPGAIIGLSTVCAGGSFIRLSDFTTGGAWSSSNTTAGTVSSSGTVIGGSAGTTIISYTMSPLLTCATATLTVNVIATPTAMTPTVTICSGNTIALSDAATGGTWSSSTTAVATVDVSSGLVLGSSTGTARITYSTGCGSAVTTTVTVIAAPGPITGPTSLCSGGAVITLSDNLAGGSWSSSNSDVATIDPLTGDVTSTLPGTTVISYLTTCTAVTSTVTVLTIPGSIIGAGSSMCVGTVFTLSDGTSGGTWTTGSTTIATVDPVSGGVHGIAEGTALITYSTGCGSTPITGITVLGAPGPITGPTSMCSASSVISLSDASAGGSWSSSVTTVATVDAGDGTVTSTTTGTTVITYSNGCGTDATTTITVATVPSLITGPTSNVCVGANITLSDAVSGGTWSSGNTAIATANPVTGQIFGVSQGPVTISYSTGCGSPATAIGNVRPLPGPILGGLTVCSGGATISLTDAVAGGTWSTSVSTVATVGSSSGLVTSGGVGSTTITYSTVCGSSSATVTVPGLTGAITPAPASVCAGSTITLSDPTPGGTWSASSTALATVGSATGVVSGLTGSPGGTVVITYTTGCGSAVTATVTVVPAPLPITGPSTVCSGGGTMTLSDAVTGGTWSSGTPGVATIGSLSGLVTGGVVGSSVVTYSNGCGAAVTATVTAIGGPAAISPGTSSLCSGGLTETLSDGVSGGTWSSATSTVATVVSTTGVVRSGVVGTAVITYSTGCGTAATATVTVINAPTAITPVTATVCFGSTLNLSDGATGGTWSSNLTAIATVNSTSGLVTGSTVGTAVISYSIGCGTAATRTVTVLGVPGPLSGPTTPICAGNFDNLSDATTGGTWSSSVTTVATVVATVPANNAFVYTIGTVSGTSVITYSTGCGSAAQFTVTATAVPTAILGTLTVCSGGGTTTLSDATAGGTWSSSVLPVATVGSLTGIVTGTIPGTTLITYGVGCGATFSRSVTVLGTPAAISPASASICSGNTVTLSDATTGGTWTSSLTTVATVGSVPGVVTGTGTGGTTLITYSTGCGAAATRSVTVTGIPTAISGLPTVCSGGSNITLSDAVAGGTWSTSVSAVATVGSASGLVTSGITGSTTITYSTGCGAAATRTVTVVGVPVAISPLVASICSGTNITLSDATTGGTWTTSTSAVATVGTASGIVTGGIVPGTSTITYSTGCGADVTRTVTVTGIPGAISGPVSLCAGGANITLSDAMPGGTWSTSVSAVATIGSASGFVTSGIVGSTTITYSTGCGADATHTVTALGVPVAISPVIASICSGANITLSDATTGGTWTTSTSAVATVGSASGIVTGGIVPGTSTITYSTGCGANATRTVTVTGIPGAISGLTRVCSGGSNITLSDGVAGGTWSTSVSAVATIGSATGFVTSGIAGTTTITYATSCASSSVTVTVLGTPVALNPTFTICSTGTVTLTDATTGGTWSTNNSTVATVGSATGFVTGGAAGTARITYSTGCGASATTTVTVIGIPVAISPATANICQGANVTLSDATANGTWSSDNTGTATIDVVTGLVTGGVTTGTAIISYSTGCGTIATGTVNVLGIPDPISGLSAVCSGSIINLSDDITGGTWSSDITAVATVAAATGVVTGGTIGGIATITYSTGCGADATTTVAVTAIPAAISGSLSACFGGGVTTLSDASSGGVWSSNNTVVATVDPSLGIVTGGVPGSATISYISGCGLSSVTVTVSSSPGAITGTSFVCPGSAVTLSDATAGGAWTSSNTTIATVDPSLGIVTGVAAGTANITYFTGCGAGSVFSFTVNPLPAVPAAISGSAVVCTGSSITLTDATAGGVWSSGNTTIGTIGGATGTLVALTTGTVTVSYTVTNSCGSNSVSSDIAVYAPIAAPAGIIGASTVCQGASISLSDSTASGVWSSSNTLIIVSASGVCNGVAGGSSVISYTISNACSNASAVKAITIMPLPSPASITGYIDTLCAGSTIALSDITPGGVWSSDITSIARVSNTGVVTAVSGGGATIFYSVTNTCGTVASDIIVTVRATPPLASITGSNSVCLGSSISLTDANAGGTWSSSSPAIAIVGTSGLVVSTGLGVATISYTISFACGTGFGTESVTKLVTVNTVPNPGIITGSDHVCVGYTIALSDNMPGGVWSSDYLATAIVTSAGVVNGIATGTDVIRYTVTNSCGTEVAIKQVTVILPTGSGCVSTGITTVTTAPAELKVFPNPNGGTFTLNLASVNDEPVRVTITNMVGEKVKEINTTTNTDTEIQVTGAAGIYFINTVTAHEKNMVKVVIQ